MIGLELDDEISLDISLESSNLLIEKNIIPSQGNFLGLDISKTSSGICFYKDGVKRTEGSTLQDYDSPFAEVLMRRELKEDILGVVGEGTCLDLAIVEDVYVGENADTVRKLFAINTAIDELIIDGKITCKEFVRVANKKWKSWISVLDRLNEGKGLGDKEKIQICLGNAGIFEDGDNYQDKLDATGMVIGYFLKGRDDIIKGSSRAKKKLNFNDVQLSYVSEESDLFYSAEDIGKEDAIEVVTSRVISKKKIKELLESNPSMVFRTNKVHIGGLSKELKLPIILEGGYLAFWIKRSKLSNYKGETGNEK